MPSVPAMVPDNIAPSRRQPLQGSFSENERLSAIEHFIGNFSDRWPREIGGQSVAPCSELDTGKRSPIKLLTVLFCTVSGGSALLC